MAWKDALPSRSLSRTPLLAVAALWPLASAFAAVEALGPVAGGLRLLFGCLAPGLALLSLSPGSARAGRGRTWVAALALSPPLLVAATAVFALAAGRSPDGALAVVLPVTFGLLVGVAAAPARRTTCDHAAGRGAGRGAGARGECVGTLPVVALVALAAVALLPEGARLSYHGVLHNDIAAQIATGTFPPENPALAGQPVHYYWLYHWLLVLFQRMGGFSILVNAPLVNTMGLLIYVAASFFVARRFLSAPRAALAALSLGFATNLLFPLLFLAGAAASRMPEPGFYWPFHLLAVGNFGGDPRIVTTLAKFWNVSGFPLGLALWALIVDELLPRERGRPRLEVLFVALCGTILFHPVVAMAAYGALSLAHASAVDLRRIPTRTFLAHVMPVGLVFAAALAVTSPYWLSVSWDRRTIAGSVTPLESSIAYNAAGLALGATPLVLAVLAGAWRGRAERLPRFLAVATLVLLLFALLLSLPDGNQYKFVHAAALPGGALLFWLLRGDGRARALGRIAFAGAVGLGVASHGITAVAYARSGMSLSHRYAGDGPYLTVPGDPALDALLRWVRGHTPSDAVIVSSPVRFASSPITAVTGRNDFALQGGPYWRNSPEYAERIQLVVRLFAAEGEAGPVLARMVETLDRPLYVLLLREQFPERFPSLLQKFARAPEILTVVHEAPDAVIYAVRRHRSADAEFDAGRSRRGSN